MISTRSSVEEEHSFDTEGCGGEGSFDMIGGSGEDDPGNKAICFYAIANAAGEFCFLETTLEIVEVQDWTQFKNHAKTKDIGAHLKPYYQPASK